VYYLLRFTNIVGTIRTNIGLINIVNIPNFAKLDIDIKN